MVKKQHWMRCETCTLDSDNNLLIESTRDYDLYSHEDRKWLAKHSWWAAHNGFIVVTYHRRISHAHD